MTGNAEPPERSATPSVTVVVPARNEERSIGSALESVLAQTWRDLEVLVVDGNSDDATDLVVAAYADRDPRIRLLHSRRGIPSALNLGLSAARGTWLVRLDAHSTISVDYVATAVERLRSGRWGGVGGRKDAVATSTVGRAVAAALGSPFGVGDSRYHYVTAPEESDHVPFGAYPVALCRELGGWDETVLTNEDYEFDFRVRRAGHRLLLDPRLRIEWHCRESLPDLARQYSRYGRGKAAVARKHPQSLRTRHLAAPALVVLTVVAAAVSTRRPRWGLAMCSPYVVANVIASATTPRPSGAPRRLLPIVFAVMHLSWGSGFWAGLLLDRRRAVSGRAPDQ